MESEPQCPATPAVGSFDTIDQWRDFVTSFENATLPLTSWNHHAHLSVALWYVTEYRADSALEILRLRIHRFNEAVGVANTDTGGYHETLTAIFILGIASFVSQRDGQSASLSILNELLNSDLADKKWPLRFYSRERITSVEARRGWVEPDLNPAPTII